jgi:purine-nucleoside/S-methyl-5'-thioadenosine phosphorylase / adenosine deaminase
VDRSNQSVQSSALCALRAPWPEPHILHGFFGRIGGTGSGPFASLNLSYKVGDERASVDENWSRVRASLPTGVRFAGLNQVHGAIVRTIDGPAAAHLEGDGLVTARSGIMLSILTADCVPVLLVDTRRNVAGALHAGWRGTLEGIARSGIQAMAASGSKPQDIRAALGPSIGLCCFEVDEELAQRFRSNLPSAEHHMRAGRPGKAFLDLRAIITDELERCGLARENIAAVGPCTKCASGRYFSRRAAGGAQTGLQLSCVGFARGAIG